MGRLPKRFRVRTLLILVLVVGVPLGLWKRARNEKLAVEATYAALEQRECTIDYEYREPTFFGALSERLGISYPVSSRVKVVADELDKSLAELLNRLPAIRHFESCTGCYQFEHLHARPACEEVVIQGGDWGADLSFVARLFPNVKYLDLSGTAITDDDIAGLSRIETLEELNIGTCKALTARSYAQLKQSPSLRSLTASDLSPESIAEIAQIKSLETLHIYRSDLSANSWQSLQSLSQLEDLSLRNCSIPSGTRLPLFSKLSCIDLSGSRFPGEWVDELSKISKLGAVTLESCPVELTDHHAEQLLQLPHLWKLDLSGSTCSEAFVVRLLAHPHLNEIWLNNCYMNWEDSTVWPERTGVRTLYLWDVKLPQGKQEIVEKSLSGRASFSRMDLLICH